MFSKGQLIFAVGFAITFMVVLFFSYRKDFKLHQKYYKNVWKVGLGILLIFILFATITFYIHE